jgi:hypothetical protein
MLMRATVTKIDVLKDDFIVANPWSNHSRCCTQNKTSLACPSILLHLTETL